MSITEQLSARERINTLLDDYSFVEIGALVTKRNTDFNMQVKETPSDGVITGYGLVDGKLVYVYSQDATVLGGSLGEMHAKKISHIYELALKVGAPVIGFIDSSGFRLQEATDALDGFGQIYRNQAMASGVIPQITAVFGNSGGGLAIMASLSDFVFMEKSHSNLFVNSPNTLNNNFKEKCDTASASYQAEVGVVDYVDETDANVIQKVRELVTILPNNYEDDESFEESNDDLNRLTPSVASYIGDTKRALIEISDNNYFFEIKSEYAKDMVTGFIRLDGMTVGAVANRSEVLDDQGGIAEKLDTTLSVEGCDKADKFIKFCDAFNIPILTLTNVTGYKATVEQESKIAKAVAKLTFGFTDATVPKVNVIVGKAYGSAYITMNSKHIGADLVFALPNAEIGMMNSDLAAQIMYAGEDQSVINEKAQDYSKVQSSVEAVAKRGYVDSVIEVETVRKNLIYAFEMLFTKKESSRPDKKHSSI